MQTAMTAQAKHSGCSGDRALPFSYSSSAARSRRLQLRQFLLLPLHLGAQRRQFPPHVVQHRFAVVGGRAMATGARPATAAFSCATVTTSCAPTPLATLTMRRRTVAVPTDTVLAPLAIEPLPIATDPAFEASADLPSATAESPLALLKRPKAAAAVARGRGVGADRGAGEDRVGVEADRGAEIGGADAFLPDRDGAKAVGARAVECIEIAAADGDAVAAERMRGRGHPPEPTLSPPPTAVEKTPAPPWAASAPIAVAPLTAVGTPARPPTVVAECRPRGRQTQRPFPRNRRRWRPHLRPRLRPGGSRLAAGAAEREGGRVVRGIARLAAGHRRGDGTAIAAVATAGKTYCVNSRDRGRGRQANWWSLMAALRSDWGTAVKSIPPATELPSVGGR